MKKELMKRVSVMLILLVLLFTSACGTSVPGQFDDGANRFAAGKDEENYYLPNSGALLSHLIDEFSGSMTPPSSQRMDDEDYDEAKKRAEEDEDKGSTEDPDTGEDPTGSTDPTGGETAGGVMLVENDTQLKRAFMDAYVPSAPRVHFEVSNGYTVNLNGDLLNDIYRELQREDPIGVCAVAQWSYGVRGNEYIIEITYNIPVDELNRMKSETPGLVQKAIQEMNVNSNDHYTIICAVNEYLCDTVVYPPNEPYAAVTHTSYGAFHGDAVCEGYAIAAKLMLNELGIRCDIQVGVCTNGGGHAWNLVELENQWYQMDVTWNDGGGRRTDYLLVTDAYMKKSRTWDESDYPKSATTPYSP